MSAYNFPNSPSNGDTVTVNGVVYTYNSTDNAWKTGTGQSPAILSDGSSPSLGNGITAAEIRTLIGAGTSSVDISSIAGDIIPDGNETRDLGSNTNKFKDLYLSGTSIKLGNQTIAADSSNIIVGQLKIGSGSNQVTLSGGSGGTLETGGTSIFSGAFSDLTGKPTTIAGYGITDAVEDFADLNNKPTTISGYGITDAFSGAFSALSGKPTTIAGYGITDAFSGAFSALSGKPTTISGYGITDAFDGAYSSLSGVPTTIAHKNADIDIGSNDFITTGKVYFANMFAQTSNLPSATTYHGMFAHVHNTGAAYFAHGGNWIELANKSYVDTQVTALVDSAPSTLNTLNELAAALNDDANFATTVTTSLGLKAPLASPALTGTPTAPTASANTNNTQIATTAYVDSAVGGASGTYTNASVDTHLNTSTASTNEVLSWNGSDYDWVAQSGGGGGGASVTTSDAAPSSPSAGDLWYNTSAGGLFVYYQDANSAQWVEVVGKTGATGPTNVSIGDAAPSSPSTGQFWWNSSANKLYIYYTDANSSQWVQATTPGAASTVAGPQGPTGPTGPAGANGTAAITRYANVAGFPASPTAADLAYANDTNTVYVYNGTAWEVIASGNDQTPVITTEPPTTTQNLNTDGTTSTVTMVAQDPEGFDITYGIAYKTANNARPAQLSADTTINQSTGVFTFTPTTTQSDAGSFRARLSASDGARITTRFVDFDLSFYPASSALLARYEFYDTNCYNPSTSTTALNDNSGNGNNQTISNPGTHTGSGNMTFNSNTTITFTGLNATKAWFVLYYPPSGWNQGILFGNGGSTYYATFHNSQTTNYYGPNYSAHSGATIVDRVNGTNATNRQTAYNAMDISSMNSVINSGTNMGISGGLTYQQYSSWTPTHYVRAMVFFDRELTLAEMEALHNHYRTNWLAAGGTMPTWGN
tara:strand:+ start:5078 stop:7873 length:2796 start_codon:yes stop_codon:yes gene_type:complete